jgi:hypothetical protein
MKKLIVLFVLLVGGIAGVGFNRGWFHLTVDSDKIREDEHKALDKAREAEQKVEQKVAEKRGN